MREKILIFIGLLIIIIFSGCVQTDKQPPIQPTPGETITKTPVSTETPVPTSTLNYNSVAIRKDKDLGLEIDLNVDKNSFVKGDNIKATLNLKNIGDKKISIEYFPNIPFNVLLYDKDGNILETFRGEKGASMASSAVLNLIPEETFSGTLNLSIERDPGTYQISGGFIGSTISTGKELNKEGPSLVKTEKIAINIT